MNTKPHFSSYRMLGSGLVALGAIVSIIGSQMPINASLTNQGSYRGTIETLQPMLIDQQVVLPAAMERESVFGILAFGMLMMLLGFGLHAFIVVRNQEVFSERSRRVPVKQAKKIPKKFPRNSRRQMEVIWVERTIRL